MKSAGEKRLLVFGRIAQAAALRTLYIGVLFLAALTAGFFVFAHRVSVMPAGSLPAADGIVVLTGDEDRISEAIQLLAKGRAGRLLISGVNKATRAPEIISFNKAGRGEARLFRCCVDLDKRSYRWSQPGQARSSADHFHKRRRESKGQICPRW